MVVHYPECGDFFTGIYICQNLNCAPEIHVLIVDLLFLNKAASNHWDGRIFCPQSFPGLRSFHSGSFTPWMNTSSLTPWLTPHLGKEELIWLSRAGHLSGCCTRDRVTVPQKQEAGSTLPRLLPTPRPGGHSANGRLLSSLPTRRTGARPPCPWEKAHHAPLVGRKFTGDPHQRLLSAPPLPRVKWLFWSLCGYRFFVCVLY